MLEVGVAFQKKARAKRVLVGTFISLDALLYFSALIREDGGVLRAPVVSSVRPRGLGILGRAKVGA